MPQFCGHNLNVWFWLCCFDVHRFLSGFNDCLVTFFSASICSHACVRIRLVAVFRTNGISLPKISTLLHQFIHSTHTHIMQPICQFEILSMAAQKKHTPIQCQWIYLEFYTIIIEPNYKLVHSGNQFGNISVSTLCQLNNCSQQQKKNRLFAIFSVKWEINAWFCFCWHSFF